MKRFVRRGALPLKDPPLAGASFFQTALRGLLLDRSAGEPHAQSVCTFELLQCYEAGRAVQEGFGAYCGVRIGGIRALGDRRRRQAG